MTKRCAGWICTLASTTALLAAPPGAEAQIFPPGEVALGERYHVEVSGSIWLPSAHMVIASESLGILGDSIDLGRDLGIEESQRFQEFRLVLRPATKHKFKLQYSPLSYSAASTLTREFVFNGLRYRVGVPVETSMTWKMLRLGYEYDFIHRERGYAGFMLDARLLDVGLELVSPIGVEFARARGPVPSFGFTGRGYPVPFVSITGEVSIFKLPESLDERYRAAYLDIDVYGTVNFTNWAGVQIGYHRFNIDYQIEQDTGDMEIGGLYFAGVLRY
jgi:hypothetical protein